MDENRKWSRRIARWGGLVIALFISSCAFIQIGPTMAPLKEKVIMGKGKGKVLLLDIEGMISNQKKRSMTGTVLRMGMIERVREILQRAERDGDIRALLIRMNSPGGTVTASDIIFHELKTFKKRKNIKIYVSIVDMAASGGYYISMAADKIVAHPTSLTGSIGVIAFKLNVSGLLEKFGVDWEVVKSGDKKDFLSPLRSFTDEERQLFQETIDAFHDRFVKIIADNRPDLDIESVRSLADGRIYNARQALEAKLIDHIGYMDDTLTLIKTDVGLPNLRVVTYFRPGEYKSNLYSSTNIPPTINMVNIDLGLKLDSIAPSFMYMWMP